MSSVPFLSGLANLASALDGGSAEGGRAASTRLSSGASRGGGGAAGLTLGPVLGVTATISAKGLQALAGDAAHAVGTVVDTATDVVGDTVGVVGHVVGNVVGYGVMAALGGGAVLDELV
ncbi:hypothetical protein [Mitsuaria sp. GD03876]|uniref:hypothetical protein n=1 Tax=Mitsuaria sp. GD03876 TaxID=2975399 RepID=UPI002447DCE0|nr:hypothetical protein [Mitsuaria sp. GD03876]MDH0864103.1 hypothetical protein [Mitsuaria sp. GD03876]